MAVVQDFDADRFLLVRAHGWVGSATITCDGVELAPPFEEEKIELYGSLVDDAGRHEDRSRTASDYLGIWIPLERDETFRLDAYLESPEAVHVTLNYNPKEGWSGAIKPIHKNKQ